MSYPQKTHFLKNREFTFFWKYFVCKFTGKIEISEYPIKVLYVTYSPYKYELHRTKTHEIRAKYFLSFFNSPHCRNLSSAHKITYFCSMYHMLAQRGVIHKEFLWNYFFRKVLIFLNICIYYDFFMSLILFNLSAIEVRP